MLIPINPIRCSWNTRHSALDLADALAIVARASLITELTLLRAVDLVRCEYPADDRDRIVVARLRPVSGPSASSVWSLSFVCFKYPLSSLSSSLSCVLKPLSSLTASLSCDEVAEVIELRAVFPDINEEA